MSDKKITADSRSINAFSLAIENTSPLPTKIHVESIGGNFYAAARWVNEKGLSNCVIQFQPLGGLYTQVVLRVNAEEWKIVAAYCKSSKSFEDI